MFVEMNIGYNSICSNFRCDKVTFTELIDIQKRKKVSAESLFRLSEGRFWKVVRRFKRKFYLESIFKKIGGHYEK